MTLVFIYFSAPKCIKQFALDEADEMLSRGFKDQIYEIFQKLATDTQVILYFYFLFPPKSRSYLLYVLWWES